MPYSKMKLAVGLFVLTVGITIFSFLYLLLDEKGTFDKRYEYNFITSSASSFSVGMPIKFSGFDIGVIDNMSLLTDGTVLITFSLVQDNRQWISKGSYLTLIKPLIGSPHINLQATIGNEILPPNSLLEIRMNDDINDMISKLEPVVDKITNIIDGVDIIVSGMAKKDSDLALILKNIETLTASLANSDSLLTTITGDRNSTQSIINSMHTTDKIMQDVKNLTGSLEESVLKPSSSAIVEVDSIMQDVKQKLENLDSVVKSVGGLDSDLVEIKEQISVGLQKSNQIMDKVDSIMEDDENSEVALP